jgi:hypothetical protein
MLSVIHFSSAGTGNSVSWFSEPSPLIAKVTDLAAAPTISNKDCVNLTVQVDYTFSSPFQDNCYVSTTNGLIEHEGEYIQPLGYNKAYPLKYMLGGNPVIIPVPNQAGAMQIVGNGFGTVYLSYYKDLYNHMVYDAFSNRFNINVPADLTFRYEDGSPIQFNYASQASDPNGRYILVDTVYTGYVVIDTLNLGIKPIADSYPVGSYSSGNADAINSTGKLAAIANNANAGAVNNGGYFKIVDTGSCTGTGLAQSGYVKSDFQCLTTDLLPQISQSIPQLSGIFNVRFANDRTLTFVAKSGNDSSGYKYARYSMSAGGLPASLIQYEAVGDSYISGEGASDYRTGTNTELNKCHQSLLSYPYLLSSRFNSFASVACSGAEMHNIAPPTARDEKVYQTKAQPDLGSSDTALDTHLPGIVLQNDFITQDNPEAITLSIGGNDIGFADIIQKCINPFQPTKYSVIGHLTCYNTYEERLELVNAINDQFPKLRSLYESMKTSGAGDRRVYVIGYPQIIKSGGDCGGNVAMNASETLLARDLIDYLDGVIRQAAAEAGVGYVDTQNAFDGQRLCEGAGSRTAVNGLTFASQPGSRAPDVNGSFHPNAIGHELLAGVVAAQTHNLTNPMPVAQPKTNQYITNPNAAILQDVQHTGRQIRKLNPHLTGIGEVLQKSLSFQFAVNSRSFFTKPGAMYSFTSGLTNLGSFIADSSGNINVTASLPADTPPGYQTLHIYGNDVFGQPIDLQKVVFVANSNDDYDGDGVLNDSDSCPLIAQTDIDDDHDGIDDACDPLIVAISPTTPPNDEIIWQDNSILRINISATRPQTTTGQ